MDSTITDNSGRVWNVTLTLENVREVKKHMGIDLFDMGEAGGFVQVAADPQNLGDVISYLVEHQAARHGFDERKKAEAFKGLHAECVQALKAAFLNFCPPNQKGKMVRMVKLVDAAILEKEKEILTRDKTPQDGGTRSTKQKPSSDSPADT